MNDIVTHDVSKEVVKQYLGLGSDYFIQFWALFGIIILFSLIVSIILFISKTDKSLQIAMPVIYLLIFIVSAVYTFSEYQSLVIKDELHVKSQDINIETKVDDINNGSDKNNQELRFNSNGYNYYITLDKNIAVRVGDNIKIKGDNLINTNKDRHSHDLSRSLNSKKLNVTITHDNQNLKTKSISKDSIID